MAHAKGLEHAPQPVIQVQSEQQDRDDVSDGNRNHTKSGDYVVEYATFFKGQSTRAKGQMQNMVDDERRDDRTAPHHGARSIAGIDRYFLSISDRPRFLRERGELDGSRDMQRDRD